jgi:mannan polymerase II complex MNN10 subunit
VPPCAFRALYNPDKVTLASQSSFSSNAGQRRRRSSAAKTLPPNLNLGLPNRLGTTSGLSGGSLGEGLPTIPGTPAHDMSRSPSPRPGGWSSPGLNTLYDSGGSNGPLQNVTWASAQARSAEVKGYPSFTPRNQGFFSKHFRRISTSLPISYGDKEKLGRGRTPGNKLTQMMNRVGWNLWRLRRSLGVVLFIVFSIIMFYATRKYRARSLRDHR